MNETPTVVVGISLLFQLCVAVYAMRLTRLFGTARVGWSLFSAFMILALLHSCQAMNELHSSSFFEIRVEVVYALASLLLLIGLTHVSSNIKHRLWIESEEHRLVGKLETEVAKKTEHLTLAIKELQSEIEERKRVEGQVRDQARLLDLSHDAIIVQDLECRIQFWNKGAESIFGWKAAEAIGRKYSDLLSIDVLACKSAGETVLSKGLWKGESSIRTKDGKEALVEGTWTMVYDSAGQPKSIMVVSANVTDQRALEARTLRSQRLESIGTLAGGIAHDLNNVLTPVLVSVQLLKEKVATDDEKELLEALRTNVMRGAQLVKQILTFGRGVKGDRAVVQPEKVLWEIKQFVLQTFPKSLSLKVNVQKDLWSVLGDATQIHQVLLNLCVNARDAMPDGGRLSILMENVTLDEAYVSGNSEAKPGPHVLMTVIDTGTGIPKAIQSKIFEPFFTTKPPGKGTGLGLSTCFSIVKNHGGFINCYSEPGNGTSFNVYVPACLCTVATDCAPTEPVSLSRGHGELVLVVDDENMICEFTQIALESHGYRTILAGDGKEALDLFKKHRDEVAVILMDMSMPVMDGPAAIEALRAINQQVPIIGTSGLACVNEERTARHLSRFLAKPYTAEMLFQSLHNALHPPSSGTVKPVIEHRNMETASTASLAIA